MKSACLRQCRSPAAFLVERWHSGRFGALMMGLEHGAYCAGCCWALMALLFAFGVMNLLWVAALAACVLAEKLFPSGTLVVRVGAIAMIGFGVLLLWRA
jgi:predicted metal-binding membrane protein